MSKLAALLAASAMLLLGLPNAAVARPADQLETQQTKVREAEFRLSALQKRMARLFTDLGELNADLASTASSLGVSAVRLQNATRKAGVAQQALNQRAREAYKRGSMRELNLAVRVESLPEFNSYSRYVDGAIKTDKDAYDRLIEAVETIKREQLSIKDQKQLILETSKRADDLKAQIQGELQSEQQMLSQAQAQLSQLEAERKRQLDIERRRAIELARKPPSASVQAARSARQVILDRKLAELLAWAEPATGPAQFDHPKLKPSGVVTSGATSWYGPGFEGRRASSGATYRMTQHTAASLVLPFGTLLKVTHQGRSVIVVITDRGPYIAGRVLDLSWAAAQAIGVSGVKQVQMEIMLPKQPAPPFP